MRIRFEFPSSSEFSAVSAITGAVYIWDNVGVSSSATPSGYYNIISSAGIESLAGSAELARQYYFDVDVFTADAPSGIFSASAFDTGIYSYMVMDDDDIPVVGQFDLKEEARDIRNTYMLQASFAAITGSSVVNTNLNEAITYEDEPNTDGSIATSAARTRILARYKLFNAYGEGTSNNPVIKEASQVAYDDYAYEFLTGAAGSGLK